MLSSQQLPTQIVELSYAELEESRTAQQPNSVSDAHTNIGAAVALHPGVDEAN